MSPLANCQSVVFPISAMVESGHQIAINLQPSIRQKVRSRGRYSKGAAYRIEQSGIYQNALPALPHFFPHFEPDSSGLGWVLVNIWAPERPPLADRRQSAYSKFQLEADIGRPEQTLG